MHVGVVVYGEIGQTSGGYRYDRKLVSYLRARGDTVDVISIPRRSYPRNLVDGYSRSLRRRLDQPFDVLLQDELCHPSLWQVNPNLQQPGAIVTLVHLLRSEPPRGRLSPLFRRIEQTYLDGVDGAICTSNDTLQRVEKFVSIPSTVAYPGGRRGDSARSRSQVHTRAKKNPLRVLFVGTVSPRKGTVTLIDALSSLEGVWKADIVGRLDAHPRYVDRVRERIRSADLEDRVTIHGTVPDRELAQLFEHAHVLAVPSRYESFGMVYLEAMEYGVVPIASSVGGADEFIDDGHSGYIVDPAEITQLQRRLSTVQNDRDRLASLASEAMQAAESHPDWQSSLSQLRQFLRSVLADETTVGERTTPKPVGRPH